MSRALDFQKSVFGEHFGETEDKSVNGMCSGCGGCCSDIFPITGQELDVLCRFVRKNNYKPNTQITAVMTATYDMTCPFLNKENKCDVYDIRPQTCHLFKCWELNPFTFEKLAAAPLEVQRAYIKFARQRPETVSLREKVFGQEVPF